MNITKMNFFIILISLLLFHFQSSETFAQNNNLPDNNQAADASTEENSNAEKKVLKSKKKTKKLVLPKDVLENKDEQLIREDDVFKSLDYPELQVVPRATDRLQYETQYEADKKYLVHWPILLPSLATLYLGLSADGKYKDESTKNDRDEADLYAQGATVVGGFWLAATGLVSWMRPYRSGYNRIKKNKDTDKRAELFRERIAEETLEQQASVMKALVTLSVISNFLVTAAVASTSDVSVAQLGITGLLAFLPWSFEHRHVNVWNKHQEYKRKIYTPISSLNLRREESTRKLYPLVSLQWNF